MKKIAALALFAGALPFYFCASVYASARTGNESSSEAPEAVKAEKTENRWLDDYSKPVGFTYDARATLQAAYLYRGSYSGGPNIQAEASVGYGGLYGVMWWNIGVTDWRFAVFQPEVDFVFGFARWGLDVNVLYIHNFDCGFFDATNYTDHGNSLELRASWTVSSKLPLRILWATRMTGNDGYINTAGDTVRAWSSYLELSYTHKFPYGISLYGAIGITPWKSRYTRFQRDFAFQTIDLRLRKDWDVSKHCGLMLQGTLMLNPSAIAADKSTVEWDPKNPGNQSINANIGFGVYLK